MHNGNDKTEKLNTALVGAENERARESELRLKFAEELERARERADARVHELNYAKSYKNKLVREKSAAALRKKRELELLKDAERAAAEEKRQSELKLELDSLEERRSASASFIKNLSQKTSAVEDKPSPDNPIPKESAEEASNDSEKEATPTTVSQKTEEIAPEIRIESKRLFTKRSRYTVKRPVGINIKPMPFFMLPAPIYPNPPAPYHAPFMAPPFSPCESFVQNANEGLELAFAPQNQAAYDAPEAFCEEVPRGFSAAPFFAAPLAIKAVRNPRFYERQSAQSPAFELGYNAPADYPAFTDTDYASGNFEAFSDADHVSHRYGNYTDVDHAPHSYEGYTDADHVSHRYEGYTDVDHAPHSYEGYTDVDHAPHSYENYTDADHVSHRYEGYTDVDHAPHSYEGYTDADHVSHRYEGYTDVDHAPHSYEGYTDVDHAPHSYEGYTDVEHAPHSYEGYTDADHISHRYENYTDVDHAPHSYEGYTDVEHAPHSYENYTDADHVSHRYEGYTDVDHAPHSYEGYTDVDHAHHTYDAFTDTDHAGLYFESFTDYEGAAPREENGAYALVSDDYDDMRAIAAYEAMRMRRGRGEGIYEGYDANYAVNENLAPVSEFSGEELPTELNFESYGEREIAKYLKESDRRVREYERAISKKEKSMRKLSREDKTRALLDTVNLNKHVVDLRAVALRAVVISADTKSKKQRRRLLVDAINNYNSALSDYEARSQESFKKLSLSLVADVSEGKPYTPVALISYSGESALNLSESFADSENDEAEIISRREMNLEGLRFLKETRREEKRIARYAKGKTSLTIGRGEKITSFTKNIERDAYLVKTRNDSLLTEAESSLDYLEYSFSASHKDKARARREIKEKIRKLKKTRKSSVKLARRDSERYYSQLLVNAEGLGITKRLTVDKLESLHMRLEALLSERERINEQLIKLYSGDLRGGKDKKINKKIKRVKARVAKRVSKRFRRNMRVLEKRVPLDIKEKLAKSVNKIIDAEILIATLKLKIRKTKPKRDVKRDMKAKIRENRAAIKYYLADYRRFLKRARAYAERSFGIKIQIIWVLASLAVLITLGAFYIRFEEPVNAFFARVFDYIGSAM